MPANEMQAGVAFVLRSPFLSNLLLLPDFPRLVISSFIQLHGLSLLSFFTDRIALRGFLVQS